MKYAVVYTSIAVVFFSFCGLVVWNLVVKVRNKVKLLQIKREFDPVAQEMSEFNNNIMEPLLTQP